MYFIDFIESIESLYFIRFKYRFENEMTFSIHLK